MNGQELCRFKSCAISSRPVLRCMYVCKYVRILLDVRICMYDMFFGGGGSSVVE